MNGRPKPLLSVESVVCAQIDAASSDALYLWGTLTRDVLEIKLPKKSRDSVLSGNASARPSCKTCVMQNMADGSCGVAPERGEIIIFRLFIFFLSQARNLYASF